MPKDHLEILNRAVLQFYSSLTQARLQQQYFGTNTGADPSGDDETASGAEQLANAVWAYVIALFGIMVALGVGGLLVGLAAKAYFCYVGKPVARDDWASGGSRSKGLGALRLASGFKSKLVDRVGGGAGPVSPAVDPGGGPGSLVREASNASSVGLASGRSRSGMLRRLDSSALLGDWRGLSAASRDAKQDLLADGVITESPLQSAQTSRGEPAASGPPSSRLPAAAAHNAGRSMPSNLRQRASRNPGAAGSLGQDPSTDGKAWQVREEARAADAPEFRRQQRMLAAELETAVGTHPADLLFDVYKNVNRLAQ